MSLGKHWGMLAALLPCAATLLLAAPIARADGDPASDVLLSQPMFLPVGVQLSSDQTDRLAKALADAKREGFTLKVAVILSRFDLGTVPVFLDQAPRYAQFLGQEVAYYFKHEILVVMPHGYGLYKFGGLPAGDQAIIDDLPPPNSEIDANQLVEAATTAVKALAAHHRVAVRASDPTTRSSSPDTRSSSSNDRKLIFAAVFAGLVTATVILYWRRSRRRR